MVELHEFEDESRWPAQIFTYIAETLEWSPEKDDQSETSVYAE